MGPLNYKGEMSTTYLWLSLSYCSENSHLIIQQLQKFTVKFVRKRNMKLDNGLWHFFLKPLGRRIKRSIVCKAHNTEKQYIHPRKVTVRGLFACKVDT
jgi:hypothetical protein